MTITVPTYPGTVLNALHSQFSSVVTKKRFAPLVLVKRRVLLYSVFFN